MLYRQNTNNTTAKANITGTQSYEWANAPDVEVYLNDDVQNMQFEVWLPVVKK